MHTIEIQNLTKYYGKAKGIDGLTFDVKEGEIFGFIGPNGAGKSTTIRLLMGLIFPTSGQAKIFGKDCIKDGPYIRSEVGYLPSEVFYYEKMKVIDLLNYSAGFYKKDCKQRIKTLADTMELDLNRRIEDLSYGNKKKVGIVQGLLHSPKLIILDEPTSGLDPLMQNRFFKLIEEENKQGATVFFSSHILSEVQTLCSRVGIIKEGGIVKVDDIKTMREDTYKKISIKADGATPELFDFEGITNMTEIGDGIPGLRFLYKGEINTILSRLQNLAVKDLLIEDPTLEEIFMHYYR